MTEMRDSGSIAFIGPDDTCSSEALVAAAWNLPMISYVCCNPNSSYVYKLYKIQIDSNHFLMSEMCRHESFRQAYFFNIRENSSAIVKGIEISHLPFESFRLVSVYHDRLSKQRMGGRSERNY